MKTKKEKITWINHYFGICEQCAQGNHDWEKYLALICQYERDYRKTWREAPHGLTISEGTRLMAVTQIFRCFVAPPGEQIRVPDPKDFFFVRPDVYAGYAIAMSPIGTKILVRFNELEMLEFITECDWAELENELPKLNEP